MQQQLAGVVPSSVLFKTHDKPHRLDGPLWHLVRSKPNQERVAFDAIQALGIEAYLPRFERTVVHAGRKLQSVKALFPGYLFASAGTWFRKVCTAHGVSDVLRREAGPQLVMDEVIQDLRDREGPDGFINLNALCGVEPVPVVFDEGEKLRYINVDSPWSGSLVKFVRMRDADRAVVSTHMFKGRRFPMEVGLQDLERIARHVC